jgi:hypothetical protein
MGWKPWPAFLPLEVGYCEPETQYWQTHGAASTRRANVLRSVTLRSNWSMGSHCADQGHQCATSLSASWLAFTAARPPSRAMAALILPIASVRD